MSQDTMWSPGWRDRVWAQLERPWDLVIIGGGITGAGILREATRCNLRAVLVEQRDFAWGTSSRSSKLVHGGLRYLKSAQVGLTRTSVREREQLLAEGPGLVDPLGFLLACYEGDRPGPVVYGAGLTVYDLMAFQWNHRYHSASDFQMMAPYLTPVGLRGGYQYGDAQTDDARLTLRVIREAVADGAVALNYAGAERLLTDESGRVCGVHLRDREQDRATDVYGRVVVNAAGAWADELRAQVGGEKRLRPLQGSHLVFPGWRLPVAQAVSFMHPVDGRPIFVLPWEGMTLVGTTDVDYTGSPDDEPTIGPEEAAYLMAGLANQFPALDLQLTDAIAAFAGIRPVIDTGKADPSAESRDHVVWLENGLLTVTGGKLTTFRPIAHDALRAIWPQLVTDADGAAPDLDEDAPMLMPVDQVDGLERLDDSSRRRLLGRYGVDASRLVDLARPGELESIDGTPFLWAELRWAARAEGVVHLDDLLLRRVRLGILLPEGGRDCLPRVRDICQSELEWSDARWQAEEADYLALWRAHYAPPDAAVVPDWNRQLTEARRRREIEAAARAQTRRTNKRLSWVGLSAALVLLAFLLYRRRRKSFA